MFPSSGFFAQLPCPVCRRGCDRPHCWYKHAEDMRHVCGYSSPSSGSRSSLAVAQYGQPSVWGVAQVVNDSTDELQQINKKIKAAKFEVEREQRRLLGYCAADITPTGEEGKKGNGDWYGQANAVPSQSRKYVVDNSKPRTDLEYDPMSNFTAEFSSYKKTLKGKSVYQCDRKKPSSQQVATSPPCSPGVQHDADDDPILTVNMAASPDRKSAQADSTDSDSDAQVGPELEIAQEKAREESAEAVIDLTESPEAPDATSPNSSQCSQSDDEETVHHHISNQYDEPLFVEVPRSVECHPPKKSVQEFGSTAKSNTRHSHQELTENDDDDVIVISSSSDEDQDDLDIELSDGDPTEECYRIFMEAKNQEVDRQEQPMERTAVVTSHKNEIPAVKPKELPEKRRIAHESKETEVPAAKRRPEPQILFPLRGPVTPAATSLHKAVVLKAPMKGDRAFQSSVGQKKQEIRSAPVLSAPAAPVTTLPPQENVYITPGSTVLNVGNNLHLILPQGAVPITSNLSDVTSVLTPITPGHSVPIANRPAGDSAVRHRSVTPLLIPATPLRFSRSSRAMALSTTAGNAPSRLADKPATTKRKGKRQVDEAKAKVPHDIRQRYVTQFTEVFLESVANVDEAFKKAVAEEKVVYNRSVNKLKYLSVAVNALKRLKKQNCVAMRDETVNGKTSKGRIPLNWKKLKAKDDSSLYDFLRDYILSEEELIERNFPIQHPEKAGCAVLFANKKANNDPMKRICCRCGAMYSVNRAGKHTRMEECNYHYGKGVEKRVPGGVETRYSCCQGVMGAPPCQIFKLHVHDSLAMDGFVASRPKHPEDTGCPGVYALDCEMCYTIQGLELSRVTVVDSSLQVIYDTFLKPHNEVIDYNTRFSGISEEDVRDVQTSLAEVQKTLLSFISTETILIGHGLETDLCALKLLHGTVVDTAAVFPHRLGPPHKLSLNRLTAEYLTRIIQESVCGHDTAEDAVACMELMLLKRRDSKGKK
ncbi:RNA exonuclease 1 homolog isoform X2 [Corythoichthys intestinalis]|uniref:RNA exonuclease 1 homolog isoform X2 n=1 Tax=Corythoichthys intestinalis TaxID=161448 RepID=UPI0025A59603|nr:RNA exonuclease 1 homolog isoform X2 [Corythoichthys intestinalis]